jgi:hypothetical protein
MNKICLLDNPNRLILVHCSHCIFQLGIERQLMNQLDIHFLFHIFCTMYLSIALSHHYKIHLGMDIHYLIWYQVGNNIPRDSHWR